MLQYDRRRRVLAIGLGFLAGFVDALGFVRLGGLFVSFMSGNSTRMAVGAVARAPVAATAAGLILAFVTGVTGGAFAGRVAGRWRKPAVLALVTGLLAGAAMAGHAALPLMAAAMGAANGVFQRDGEVSIGVTYMTGTLVKFGQHLALAIAGGPLLAWVPFLALWAGLVGGAVTGAAAAARWGPDALWLAVAGGAVLTAAAVALGPTQPNGRA